MSHCVLIVDDRREALELNRILLEAEGYEAISCSYGEATLERLRGDAPAVLLLDLLLRDDAPWDLLRRVRQDASTREIGVVVTSDSPALVDRALRDASLGVCAGLVMPFDIEALYAAIAAAARCSQAEQAEQAGQPVPAAPVVAANPLLERAAELLRRERARVLLRWIQRLSTLDVFRGQPDLPLAALQGRGAEVLDGIVAALELQSSSRAVAATMVGSGTEAAHAHARLRRVQGARAGDVARELAALRREVWRAIHDHSESVAPAAPLDDVWDLLRRIDAAVDEALGAMLDGWTDDASGARPDGWAQEARS